MTDPAGTAGPVSLRPVLGRWQLLSIGIGAIIGSGIFVIPGPAAAQFAGPAIIFSFLIAAFGCVLAGLCYAELAAMFPSAGSAYSFSSRVFGRFVGWLVGWLLILEYLFAAAIVAQAFSGYFAVLLGPSVASSPLIVNLLLPVMIMAVAAFIAVRGVDFSATAVSILVAIKVGVILLVIVAGAQYVDPRNWQPFVPANTGVWGEYGWSGVLRAAGIVFYVYLGFDTVAVAAQEARRPQRDVPFALIGSLATCTLLFIPMMLVVTGMVDYRALNVANPIGVAVEAAGPEAGWMVPLVSIGATIGMASVLIVILMAQSRILFAMAQDGLLPASLARLHREKRTPVAATIATAIVACGISLSVPIATLGHMVSIGVLSAFVAVAAAVLVWRRKYPDAQRPFRAPWVPAVPIGAIIVCGYMAFALPGETWLRFGIWMVLGILIYLVYGVRSANKADRQRQD
ncbi:APC family permease [Sphingosinicella rhizophila]|uniref:Amino acid permease n=1 Tax=Sphingosinicella rhizophila TaxID=3050082 RepID=A0ABU3QAA0_9SPHN|nr:amino acid permease [Sphingosinicella sp. GR2756]MDT9600212.1 amino acid permease [Sphingosinicella sp. GR2756]